MTADAGRGLSQEVTRLRLRTLVRLRWIAVVGQTAAVLVVHYGLGFDLPVIACLAIIALSALLNAVLGQRQRAVRELSASRATLLLAYDLLQLAVLLALTGGLANPFAVLLLVPVVVSASALPPANTTLLVAVALAAATAIGFLHMPLPWATGPEPMLPDLYIAGIWVAIASTLGFMSFYAFRVAEEARQMSDALAAAELVLAREQHISALDGLAAAAAHELGTPLATIALVSRELQRDLPEDSPHADDIKLMRSQVERCRSILERIGSLGAAPAGPLERLTLTALVDETAAPHREFGIGLSISSQGERPEPATRRNPAVLYGVGNLVENAVDFARSDVSVVASWTDEAVSLRIADDGPGFAPEILAKIGEPYVTTRGRRRGTGEESGLGLGLFIAKTLLERTGAELHFRNRPPGPGRGAVVTVTWPRRLFEGGPPPAAGEPGFSSVGGEGMNSPESSTI